MSNYCKECGTKLGKNWKYCHNCGEPIEELPESRKSQLSPITAQKKSRKYTLENILDTLGCVLLIIAGIVLIIFYNFFSEWFTLIITIVITLIVISCIGRIIYAVIGEGILWLKRRKKSKPNTEKQTRFDEKSN
ncbi:MAG: hypothetical protein BAJALOKI2v1_420022 [Promethearchaeota archaeon]|nr:MAG: hypothetical protein BAJALOKI2v1_420022 [Candidatus Lokiarchaeota archaeon]